MYAWLLGYNTNTRVNELIVYAIKCIESKREEINRKDVSCDPRKSHFLGCKSHTYGQTNMYILSACNGWLLIYGPIVDIFSNLFSMFYRVSPIIFESFQVWSRLKSWRKKHKERSKNWSLFPRNNHAKQSDGWSHYEQPGDYSRYLWKFPYLSKIFPNHLLPPLKSMAPPYKKPSLSLFSFYTSFARRQRLIIRFCYCKGDGSSSYQEDHLEPYWFLSGIICSIIQLLCLVHLV